MITTKDVEESGLGLALKAIAWITFSASIILAIVLFSDRESMVGIAIIIQGTIFLLLLLAISKILHNQQVSHIYLNTIGDKIIGIEKTKETTEVKVQA